MSIDDHQLCSIPLVSAGGVSQSQLEPVILIFSQYAYYGTCKSINSHVQLNAFRNKINDKSIKLGDKQTIKTQD